MKYYYNKFKEELIFYNVKLRQKSLLDEKIHPFFIVSAGRSGTTLLRRQLMENTLVHIPPESDDNIPQSVFSFSQNFNKSWEEKVKKILILWMKSQCFRYWNLNLFENVNELFNCNQSEKKLSTIIDYIYNEHRKKYNPEAICWGDKTPYLAFRLKWVNLVFPNAKYVYLIRDGRDVVSSSIEIRNWNTEFAVKRWVNSIRIYERFARRHKQQTKMIKYEDLVLHNRLTLNQITDFLSLSNMDITKIGNENKILGDTILEHHKNIFKPINKNSIGKYKISLTEEQKKIVENRAMRFLKKYSYV